MGSNHDRHGEQSEAIQGMRGRSGGSGSPRRHSLSKTGVLQRPMVPRDDDSIRTHRAVAPRGGTKMGVPRIALPHRQSAPQPPPPDQQRLLTRIPTSWYGTE